MDLTRRAFLSSTSQAIACAAAATTLQGCAASSRTEKKPIAVSTTRPSRNVIRPPAGQVLFIAGQDGSALREYLNHMPTRPGGFTLYCSVFSGPDCAYLTQVCELPALKDSVLHLSVGWIDDFDPKMTDNNKAITRGAFDANIDRLAQWCAAHRRPILMRIGFEFDRPVPFPDFHYSRAWFATGFRRIVDRLRASGATNVSTVLASTNIAPALTVESFNQYYPGDDYVDWLGCSMWQPQTIDHVILNEARRRGKPVILAETTPVKYNIGKGLVFPFYVGISRPASAQAIWDDWHQPMIDFIQANRDVISAWHYIAQDWSTDALWNWVPNFAHCDARPWASVEFLEIWNRQMNSPPFLQASASLFRDLGYS